MLQKTIIEKVELIRVRTPEINVTNSLDLVSIYLVELSSYLASLGQALGQLEHKYKVERVRIMTENPKYSVNKVDMFAEATESYLKLAQAKQLHKDLLEHIQTVKRRQNVLQDEKKESYYT